MRKKISHFLYSKTFIRHKFIMRFWLYQDMKTFQNNLRQIFAVSFHVFNSSKREHLPRSCKFFLMVKIIEVPTLSIVLNLLYRMQQKFRRSTVKKGRITLERNPMVDIVSLWSISQLRSRVIRPFLTVDRRNFCCIR